MARHAETVRDRSGLPLDPYFSAGKLAWLLEHDDAVARAREAGTLRLGTVDSFLSGRLGAGFATDLSTASRTQLGCRASPTGTTTCSRSSASPTRAAPVRRRHGRDLGVLRHARWPAELPLRARLSTSRRRSPAPAVSSRGCVKATYGTGVFVLAHVGDDGPDGGGEALPTVPGGSIAGSSARSTAASSRRALCSSGSRATSASPPTPRRSPRSPRRWRTARRAAAAGARGGRRAVVAPDARGRRRADRRHAAAGTSRAPRSRRSRGGWPTSSLWCRSTSLEVLRVDGGLTRNPLLLQLKADTAACRCNPGRSMRPAAGSAALAAVGAGVWDSTREIAERLPVG